MTRTPNGRVPEHRRGGLGLCDRELEGEREDYDAMIAERRSRSGTRLTEDQRSATCERPESLKVRLRPGYRARLRALSEEDGYSIAEWIETWVEMAESEIASIRERPKKRPRRAKGGAG